MLSPDSFLPPVTPGPDGDANAWKSKCTTVGVESMTMRSYVSMSTSEDPLGHTANANSNQLDLIYSSKPSL